MIEAATSSNGTPSVGAAVVVAVVCAVLSAVIATMGRRRTGRNLWRMPVWLWSLIGLLTGLLGLVLAFIAFVAPGGTKSPPPPRAAPGAAPPGYEAGRPDSDLGPTIPPEQSSPEQSSPGQSGGAARVMLDFPPPAGPPPAYDAARARASAPTGPLSAGGSSPSERPAWRPDPKAPTRYRYFDGEHWTEWVYSRHAGISVNHL